MKQTEIGLIPDDWEVKRLGDIYNFQYGDGNTNPSNNGVFPVYGANGIIGGYTKFNATDSIVIGHMGEYAGSVIWASGKHFVTYNGTITKPKDEKILNPKYGYYSLLFKNINKICAGSGYPFLAYDKLNLISISLPPLAEQQRIAKALSDVDALISTTEKLLQKKKNIKQGTMQNLLTGKKRLPGFGPQTKSPAYKQTELGLIPDDWEVKKLSEFGTFSKGSGISREESNTGEYPAVRYGELYTTHNDYIKSFYSHISYEVASKSKKINKGDLLFTCSGETKEDIGKCVAFIGNEKAYAGGDLLILSPTINIDSLFYGFLLNTTVAVKQKSSMAQGDAVVHISAESIGKIQVPFPSKEEQTAIANVLSSMDKEIETLNTKLEKYRNLKTAMMQQLLTGKIRL